MSKRLFVVRHLRRFCFLILVWFLTLSVASRTSTALTWALGGTFLTSRSLQGPSSARERSHSHSEHKNMDLSPIVFSYSKIVCCVVRVQIFYQ